MFFSASSSRLAGLVNLLAFALLACAAPASQSNAIELEGRAAASKYVFAHFIVGVVSDRTGPADWDADMQRAKAMGIDAFALNIGTDSYTDQQLGYAYTSAANNGIQCFISFDFNWYNAATSAAAVGQKIAAYASKPAQLKIGGKVFASSFLGDGLDVAAMRQAAGVDVYWAPNYYPGGSDVSKIDAALSWMAWPNNGANAAPSPGANYSVEYDDALYTTWLNGKPYVAPVSPWFSTHFGREVSYSKNWVFPSDLLWFNRWQNILTSKPAFIEIISWNDYGESHYVGPLSSKHTDDGSSKWVNDMPHNAWLEMAKPFITAYKNGAASPNAYVTQDQLIYWYRPTPKSVNCDATDTTTGGRPDGWDQMSDSVFVVALLTSAGTVTVTSGSNTVSFNAPAGATAFQVPMGVGAQTFTLTRRSTTLLSGRSLRDVSNVCPCGIYNFNAYVGMLPAGPSDPLGADGLSALTNGLKVTTCLAKPSLGTAYYGSVGASATPTSTSTSKATTSTSKPTTSTSKSTTSTSKPATSTSTTSKKTTSTTSTTPKPTSTSTSKATTSTTKPATTSKPASTSSTSTLKTTTTAPLQTTYCVGGKNAPGTSGNLAGLCAYACAHNYCPAGPCVCTRYARAAPAQDKALNVGGCVQPGLDASYTGLCSYSCNRGYCPAGACYQC
ncbi:glycoside hydrolase family 71 protein [Coniochaeta ligniaria NRRL 30616]|uniref:Glycoside hydrolase family 71 protein n=1 Tax=Coniochaeta ligniaria NRRL 30616 TaxID=1408157 RepID=A0A1J7INT7_9PEZI|nr:glycoside hydrolase family 71 protein [Coniochaeta ligniaria NRRL 30616]